MQSYNERAAPPRAQSRSRVDASPTGRVLHAGERAYGLRDGFLFRSSRIQPVVLEMPLERVRANLSAALKP